MIAPDQNAGTVKHIFDEQTAPIRVIFFLHFLHFFFVFIHVL